ncbi:Uncharacterised protein [Mycobacteroides abscessus subsp. abscessus]|nr:Uncharacterised protein [Mycobacteroides abscessus subsp. abscessus]
MLIKLTVEVIITPNPLTITLIPKRKDELPMALLREMVEKRRKEYESLLTKAGALTVRKDSADFTLTEMEEVYRKWVASRKEKERKNDDEK